MVYISINLVESNVRILVCLNYLDKRFTRDCSNFKGHNANSLEEPYKYNYKAQHSPTRKVSFITHPTASYISTQYKHISQLSKHKKLSNHLATFFHSLLVEIQLLFITLQ